MSCDESNCGDIYKFLEKENLSNDTENMLYLISAPIFLFKKINLDQEILNKIELIDFPGIDVDEEIISDIFKKIIQLSDTFIFVNECNLIKKTDNINIIQKIVGRIENRKFNFDYNSCLFILNKADKAENNNINKIQKKIEFEDILFGGKSKFGYIIDFFRAKKNPEILVEIFSSLYFLKFLKFYEKVKDFKTLINNCIKEIQDEKKTTRDFDLISKLENLLKSKLED